MNPDLEKTPTPSTKKEAGESRIFGTSTRFWLAFILVLTVCCMALRGLEVKEPLYTLAISAVSFYFGNAKRPSLGDL